MNVLCNCGKTDHITLMNTFIHITQHQKERKKDQQKQQYTAYTSLHGHRTGDTANQQLNIVAEIVFLTYH